MRGAKSLGIERVLHLAVAYEEGKTLQQLQSDLKEEEGIDVAWSTISRAIQSLVVKRPKGRQPRMPIAGLQEVYDHEGTVEKVGKKLGMEKEAARRLLKISRVNVGPPGRRKQITSSTEPLSQPEEPGL